MTPDSAKKLLELHVESSNRILGAGFGVNAAESTFFEVVELLRLHPDVKAHALELMAKTFNAPDTGLLDGGVVPGELIELIAHELRWEELRHHSEHRIKERFRGDKAAAASDIAINVLAALSEDWADRGFYRRYAT